MKKYIQLALVAVMLFAATATASAQKFGYVSSAEILSELPAMKAAESNLEALQKQLLKQGQVMVTKFQADLKILQDKATAGQLTPVQQETASKDMEARQAEIGKFDQDMREDLQEKRNKLLEPIYKSINDAIEAVAKENGYQFIFDQQVLLYGEETADVSAMVKTKLGI